MDRFPNWECVSKIFLPPVMKWAPVKYFVQIERKNTNIIVGLSSNTICWYGTVKLFLLLQYELSINHLSHLSFRHRPINIFKVKIKPNFYSTWCVAFCSSIPDRSVIIGCSGGRCSSTHTVIFGWCRLADSTLHKKRGSNADIEKLLLYLSYKNETNLDN